MNWTYGWTHGISREDWPRFAFIGEHGDDIAQQARRERERQQLPEKVEVVL